MIKWWVALIIGTISFALGMAAERVRLLTLIKEAEKILDSTINLLTSVMENIDAAHYNE